MGVDYTQIITDSRKELQELIQQRDAIEARITQVVIALRALARLQPGLMARKEIFDELSQAKRKPLTLMDAISTVLRDAEEPITSADIKDRLEDSGFFLDDYSQPMATIHTTLNRLADSKRVKRGLNQDRTATYKWIEGSTPLDSIDEFKPSRVRKI